MLKPKVPNLLMAGALLLASASAVLAQSAPPLTGANIGEVGKLGSLVTKSSIHTVSGAGRGIQGWDDGFYFASAASTATGGITARLDSLAGSKNARAGVQLRNSSIADSVQASMLVSPSGEISFVTRTATTATSLVVASTGAGTLPVWVRLQRDGSNVIGSYSRNGSTWTTLGSMSLALTSTPRAGLAVTSATLSSTATALFSNYSTSTSSVQQPSSDGTTAPTAPAPTPAPAPIQEPAPAPTPAPAPAPVGSGDYAARARAWDFSDLDARFGPTFTQLNPNAVDTRPLLYKPESKKRTSGYIRTNPYELGTNPSTDGDYWTDTGQVGYLPDDPATNAGVDRIQTYSYYDKVFAISPRLDWASGKPRSDPHTREPTYVTMNGGKSPVQPIAMLRQPGMRQNEAVVIYRDGLFALVGTQTSRRGGDRFPGFVFPKNKVPTALTVTTGNEFVLVTIWDTDTKKGQLAVVAMEGKYIPFHTWPYMAMPNQGSWSDVKLLGYIDLPMSTPSAVSAASNGMWTSPSETNNKVMSQINLADDSTRKLVYDGAWEAMVAKGGYAIVVSKEENKAAIVDLSPLFGYIRESYLSSAASFNATLAARGAGPNDFPQAFSAKPAIAPRVVWQADVAKPTAVLAGIKTDRWTMDYLKGYIASEDGTIRIINTSSLMARFSWQRKGALAQVGSFNVGRNPVAMCFTRFGAGSADMTLLPVKSSGSQVAPDPLNNTLWIACRGEREVRGVVTFEGKAQIYRRISDQRMDDPVAVSVAERGNILTVADFRGRQILSFRIGAINDRRNNVIYGCGASGTDPLELAGILEVPGYPYLVGSSNLN